MEPNPSIHPEIYVEATKKQRRRGFMGPLVTEYRFVVKAMNHEEISASTEAVYSIDDLKRAILLTVSNGYGMIIEKPGASPTQRRNEQILLPGGALIALRWFPL